MVCYTLDEQNEIINEFLDRLGQNQEIQENDDSYGMITEERMRQEYNEYVRKINVINTTKYIAVKNAMDKYMNQTGRKECLNYSYGSKSWQLKLKKCENVIEIIKQGSRYVCSKEKLEAIDFELLEKYHRFCRRFD